MHRSRVRPVCGHFSFMHTMGVKTAYYSYSTAAMSGSSMLVLS